MPNRPPPDDSMPSSGDRRWQSVLTDGISLFTGLRTSWFGHETARQAETLLTLSHLLLFRSRTGTPYPLIGIMGNADSGKSTLLCSVAGEEISRVTPIPHQTTGPVLAVPEPFLEPASDPSFLRPVSDAVDRVPAGTTGLSGSPTRAAVVPSWDGTEKPFLLMDLPDIGTVDSLEENQVALRLLPWLDRIILLVTEETFAQAEHEEITRALQMLRPERARGDLFVVLNRRHQGTSDEEFSGRLHKIRGLWPNATVSSLPHLSPGERFAAEDTGPLVSESTPRVIRTLEDAVRNLAADLVADIRAQGENRMVEHRLLLDSIRREIALSCRFSRSFFSADFRRRLDVFSPWNVSMRRIRSLLKKETARGPGVVDLIDEAPVQRHMAGVAGKIQKRIHRHLEAVAGQAVAPGPPPAPVFPEDPFRTSVSELVDRTNRTARTEVETLLASLQENRKLKDPVLGLLVGVNSSLLLLELVIPGFGTLSSMTFSGLLSALGFGGILTSDMMRKLRSNRLRESFETGMREILQQAAASMLESGGALSVEELKDLSRKLADWAARLPEV